MNGNADSVLLPVLLSVVESRAVALGKRDWIGPETGQLVPWARTGWTQHSVSSSFRQILPQLLNNGSEKAELGLDAPCADHHFSLLLRKLNLEFVFDLNWIDLSYLQMLGCAIIGYMTWVLATSSLSISGFMSGTQVLLYWMN